MWRIRVALCAFNLSLAGNRRNRGGNTFDPVLFRYVTVCTAHIVLAHVDVQCVPLVHESWLQIAVLDIFATTTVKMAITTGLPRWWAHVPGHF